VWRVVFIYSVNVIRRVVNVTDGKSFGCLEFPPAYEYRTYIENGIQ
jgi:hypothetical protein